MKCLHYYFLFLEEKHYGELMKQSAKERCEWLVLQNRSLLIRECDWNKILTDIEENNVSFSRYYPMVRVKITHPDLAYLTRAIVLNDELYELYQRG